MNHFSHYHKGKHRGFTLIELLIVIAIILILIAIALPNFLEAQIRAKVTKSKAEVRTLATALESYRLDFGGYPRDHDSAWPLVERNSQDGYRQLTTPLKYLQSLIRDPFGQELATGDPLGGGVNRNTSFFYEGGSGSDESPECGIGALIYINRNANKWNSKDCIHAYLVIGIGPDKDDSCNGNDGFPYDTHLGIYSPTNGTKSDGDLYKTVGEWRRGDVRWGPHNGPYNGEGE
jgi:general secretion pathway protein G